MRIIQIIGVITILTLINVYGQSYNNDWENLFNGSDLSGWEIYGGDAEFKVENGVIVGISKLNTPSTFLTTKFSYSDFIFECEFMVDEEINSGIQFRSLSKPDYNNGRIFGYQAEIDPSKRNWSGGVYDEGRNGWLYHLEYNPGAKIAFKHNEWNKIRIEAVGNHIRIWLNDIQTADLIDDKTASGFIALQIHSISENFKLEGKTVKFKNLFVTTEKLKDKLKEVRNEINQVSYLTNKLTDFETAEDWKLLWNGKTSHGWRGAKLDHFPESGWEIKDGILIVKPGTGGESTNGGDIVTVEKYSNFVLEADYKYTPGANSGIKYFVDTELNKGAGSSIGCEYQILDDEIHPDAKLGVKGNRTHASLYDLIPANALFYAPDESTSKRENKYNWNRARIVVNGNHVEHYLNGIKVVEYERRTQEWRALVAYSKYKDWPNFGEQMEGHILLQDHGNEVWFKNIKIKVLN
ncbi:MAG: DUF1080 domain-containing protein [Bacteroidetes bacterium]|nr:DUF1080 domain-containing protein [Bacteroidota bacterium]